LKSQFAGQGSCGDQQQPRHGGAREGGKGSDSDGRGDRQPIREDEESGGNRGFDGGKKINGRKRHILVDSCSNLLAVRVTDGAVQDRLGGTEL
jgi:hypothetical protein